MSKINKDGFSLSVFALFDVFLIALLFTLFSSKFILAPGVEIELSQSMQLPKVDAAKLGSAIVDDSVSVLNLRGKSMIIYGGRVHTKDSFERAFQSSKPQGGVLLIKADSGVSGELLLDIASSAAAAGYKKVILASEPK